MILGNREIIIPFLLFQPYLQFVVDTKINIHEVIQLPAKLILLHRGHDAQQSCIAEKGFSKIMIVDG